MVVQIARTLEQVVELFGIRNVFFVIHVVALEENLSKDSDIILGTKHGFVVQTLHIKPEKPKVYLFHIALKIA